MSEPQTVLVTGATGFIGRRLVPELVERGHTVRAMTRRPEEYDGPGEPVAGDVFDRASLTDPLTDVDVAVYLVHSLDDPDFEQKDADAARTFAKAAVACGVRQIVYLGGLGSEDDKLSPHLRSRREVEQLLGETGVPVTVLRAAIVVGAGGISWELTRQLVKNLPAMVVPRWVTTLTQPIAIDDVIRYLAGVVGVPEAFGRTFEIGGPEQLTYLEMLQVASEVKDGHRLPIVKVPVLTPKALVVLARAGHRRGSHHRPQPHRLDGDRGGGHRRLDQGPGARGPAALCRGGAPGAGGPPPGLTREGSLQAEVPSSGEMRAGRTRLQERENGSATALNIHGFGRVFPLKPSTARHPDMPQIVSSGVPRSVRCACLERLVSVGDPLCSRSANPL